jgi:hypothetical protein
MCDDTVGLSVSDRHAEFAGYSRVGSHYVLMSSVVWSQQSRIVHNFRIGRLPSTQASFLLRRDPVELLSPATVLLFLLLVFSVQVLRSNQLRLVPILSVATEH